MAQITKITVLNKFIDETIHNRELTFESIFKSGMFGEIRYGSERKKDLDLAIDELTKDGFLRLRRLPPVYKWELIDIVEAVAERDRLVKENEKLPNVFIETQNNTGPVYGGVVNQGGRHSRFENLSNATPSKTPTNIDTTISKKTFWSRTLLFIWDNIWKIIVTVLAAYIVFKLGWKK